MYQSKIMSQNLYLLSDSLLAFTSTFSIVGVITAAIAAASVVVVVVVVAKQVEHVLSGKLRRIHRWTFF